MRLLRTPSLRPARSSRIRTCSKKPNTFLGDPAWVVGGGIRIWILVSLLAAIAYLAVAPTAVPGGGPAVTPPAGRT